METKLTFYELVKIGISLNDIRVGKQVVYSKKYWKITDVRKENGIAFLELVNS